MAFIADFHVHSKYSRATSKEMEIATLARWSRLKGIAMMGTGDFTHPRWLAELRKELEEVGPGVYRYDKTLFILTAEVSNIYTKAGRTRKVHNLLFAPRLATVAEINRFLSGHGDLAADGRPVVSLDCEQMVAALAEIDPAIAVVPCHAWTPHFSVFGANSGFDSLEECFGAEAGRVTAIETGLSSDPAMNWRCSRLDRVTLLSNSDAHSPAKIGREANIFAQAIDYAELMRILREKDRAALLATIEFFPEEGKYHWDGHRHCQVRLSPQEAAKTHHICPACGRRLTIGVMDRVERLADRDVGYVDQASPGYRRIVPLQEIIAAALDLGVGTATVEREYMRLVTGVGSEFRILLEMSDAEIAAVCPPRIAAGILNVRHGTIAIAPGYDGEYGTISIFNDTAPLQEKELFG